MSVAFTSSTQHLVISPIRHHAGKEDHVQEEACQPGTACISLPAPASASTASSALPPVSEESLAKLIALATSSPDSPLGLVWKHAFQEGLKEGFRRGVELFKDKDVKQAFQEGADEGQIIGILAEREEWEAAGHGQWCFDQPLMCVLCDAGFCDVHVKVDVAVQVNTVGPPPPPSSAEVAIQVDASHSFSSSPSQTDPLPTYIDAESQAQLTASVPTTTTTSTLDPPAFNWSEDATTIPIIPMFRKNQPHRDLSALHTSNPNPFSSLSHQNRRS